MEIFIRKAFKTDLAEIITFQLAMAQETEGLVLNKEILTKGVHNLFADESKGLYWVATVKGEVVGSLMTNYEWSDWRNGNVVWIQSVYIKPAFRGKKIFKAMYQYIKKWVEESDNLRGIRLYVDKTNTNAQKVYQAIGMSAEHYTMYEWLK